MQRSTQAIDSPANARIKAALALRDRRGRDAAGLTLVDGGRESRRAVESGAGVETAFVCRSLLRGDDAGRVVELLEQSTGREGGGIELVEVGGRAFERLAFGDRADGVVLVVRIPDRRLEELALPAAPLIVVTEDVEKPGNLGAILRTADAVAADAVIAAGGTDLYNPNVIRASIGTVFSLQVAAAPAAEVAAWLRGHGLRIVASRVDGALLHVEADLTGPIALVLGSEAEGLTDAWRAPDIEGIRLPMLGVADSLNVSVAGAVLLYEAWRQRHHAG